VDGVTADAEGHLVAVGDNGGDTNTGVIWRPRHKPTLLSRLAGSSDAWQLNRPAAINDRDQILGIGSLYRHEHVYLLTPIRTQ